MLQPFPRVLAVVCAAASLTLPSVASGHSRHVAAHTHVSAGRTSASPSHASFSHAGRGKHATRTARIEHVAAVHHEPVPAMDPARATEIQTALIRKGYLSGQPSGVWDADSVAAMQKLQDENGWQTKFTPDSRALVKLGLGPVPVPASPALETAEAAPAQP